MAPKKGTQAWLKKITGPMSPGSFDAETKNENYSSCQAKEENPGQHEGLTGLLMWFRKRDAIFFRKGTGNASARVCMPIRDYGWTSYGAGRMPFCIYEQVH
jgi:hypothetical protein